MNDIKTTIEAAFERRADITPRNVEPHVKEAVLEAIDQLDAGTARVAEKIDGKWVVHDWLKMAVLLSFRIEDNSFMKGGFTNYYDKVPSKFADYNSRMFREAGVRVVPPAAARRGSYIAPGVVLMPVLREHRRLCRLRHHGRHLGHRRFLRADRQERASVRRRRHRRRTGAGAGRADHHRRQLLHRRAF